MYRDDEAGVTVEVHSVKNLSKCARCFKHLPSVGEDPVFAAVCYRCASTMHMMFYDVNFGHHEQLPPNLTRDVDEFVQQFVRPHLRHMNWQELQDAFADYVIPH